MGQYSHCALCWSVLGVERVNSCMELKDLDLPDPPADLTAHTLPHTEQLQLVLKLSSAFPSLDYKTELNLFCPLKGYSSVGFH